MCIRPRSMPLWCLKLLFIIALMNMRLQCWSACLYLQAAIQLCFMWGIVSLSLRFLKLVLLHLTEHINTNWVPAKVGEYLKYNFGTKVVVINSASFDHALLLLAHFLSAGCSCHSQNVSHRLGGCRSLFAEPATTTTLDKQLPLWRQEADYTERQWPVKSWLWPGFCCCYQWLAYD